MITHTPAVLVTGSDNRGNEFCYFKSLNGWVDSYNECFITPDFVRAHVFPIVQKVYFSDLIMTGAEWVANGCPMELTAEQIRLLQDEHPANIAQDMEREMDDPRTPAEIDADAFAAEVVATRESDRPF